MSDFHNSEIESILAEAIERVESGAMVDTVIASYPAAYRDELQEILFVVDAVQQVGAEPVPMPSAERRASAKQDFLAFAREIAAEDEASAPAANDAMGRLDVTDASAGQTRLSNGHGGGVRPANGTARSASSGNFLRVDERGWFDRLADRIGGAFALPTARLAPMAAMLLLGILSISSFYTVAWSVPGDIAYPFKEWTRKVQLDVASPDERVELARTLDVARSEELAAAQQRVDQTIKEKEPGVPIDLNDAVRSATFTTIYNGRINGDLLDFGAIDVLPRFQPDANDPATFVDIEITDGKTLDDLVEGVEVEVSVQIVPDADEFVQGVQLTIFTPAVLPIEDVASTNQPAEPTTAAPASGTAATPETNTPARSVMAECTPTSPTGWSSYVIEKGDTFGSIAARYGLAIDQLARQNCISDLNRIVWGGVVRVPGQALDQATSDGAQAIGNDPVPTSPAPVSTEASQQIGAPTADNSLFEEQDGTPIPELIIPTDTPESAEPSDGNVLEPTPEQPIEDGSDDPIVESGTDDTPDNGDSATESEGEAGEDEAGEGETDEQGGLVGENPDVTEDGYPAPVVPDTAVQITVTGVATDTSIVLPVTVEVTATLEADIEATFVPTNTAVAPTVIPTVITITATVPIEPTGTTTGSEEPAADEVITPAVSPAVVTPIQPESGTSEAGSGEATESADSETESIDSTSEPEPTETTNGADGSTESEDEGATEAPELAETDNPTGEVGNAEDEQVDDTSEDNSEESATEPSTEPSTELAAEESPESATESPSDNINDSGAAPVEPAIETAPQGSTQEEATSDISDSAEGDDNSKIEAESTIPPTIESAPTAVPPTAVPPTAVPPTAVPTMTPAP